MHGRRSFQPPVPDRPWRVVRDPFGQFVLRDPNGGDPLRDPDPRAQLDAVFLAAQAPALRSCLHELLRRFGALHDGMHRDEHLWSYGLSLLVECRPPASVSEEVEHARAQVCMYFDQVA